jgi:aspartyl-tRNA(Asn)/glutamyl-tRNA(Gln) amidotransferase subunit A
MCVLPWQVRTLVAREMREALKAVDVLLSPVAPSAAYRLGEKSDDPLAMYKGDLMTVSLNLAGRPCTDANMHVPLPPMSSLSKASCVMCLVGLPAISVPCGLDDHDGGKLPVGLQIIGPAFGEKALLWVADAFERTNPCPIGMPSMTV